MQTKLLFTNSVPYAEMFKWVKYDCKITKPDGTVVFEQLGVEFPEGWDQHSVDIVTQKYFWGKQGTDEREYSLRQLIDRVTQWIGEQADKEGTLAAIGLTKDQFINELAYLIADQRFSFNSPVWFNVGTTDPPQCSACFILSVEDTMTNIVENLATEMLIFKNGSGAGSNRSALRSKYESVRGGGKASGPVSFIKVYDAGAGGIKSGGKTRRAAKMEIMDIDHLDIEDFITLKREQEKLKRILIKGGVDGSFCGEADQTVSGQNANYSVRLSDAFMEAVCKDMTWKLRGRHNPEIVIVKAARELWDLIVECAWVCADPGVQFDDRIQEMNTAADIDRINATNPCSEYVFLDDTSCNLGSHNLTKYYDDAQNMFAVNAFCRAVAITTVAMDATITGAAFPNEKIRKGTHDYRTLGMGFTGLGALLMRAGVPYDSKTGNNIAGSIMSLLSATAYETSALMAEVAGSFPRFVDCEGSMRRVIQTHADSASALLSSLSSDGNWNWVWKMADTAASIWDGQAVAAEGWRNAQISVLAPTGTISYMMGQQTSTGIEPILGLVTYKNLAGGGVIQLIDPNVAQGLSNLGYSKEQVQHAADHIKEYGCLPPDIQQACGEIFLTSFGDRNGNALNWRAHVNMMAACQPFISGAISKTINMPETATEDDVSEAYMYAWKKGLKCVAIYRDGCKTTQAVDTSDKSSQEDQQEAVQELLDDVRGLAWGERSKPPVTRPSISTGFAIGDPGKELKGMLTVGMNLEGDPVELSMQFSRVGGVVQGLTHALMRSMSYNLQLGMPLTEFIDHFTDTKFEPNGLCGNRDIWTVSSIVDFVARFLELQFLPDRFQARVGQRPVKGTTRLTSVMEEKPASTSEETEAPQSNATGEACPKCGHIMHRMGTCQTCSNCGYNDGCGG